VTLEPTYDRPDSQLGQGQYPVAPWIIGVVGALTFIAMVVFVVLWIRRALRARRGDLAPVSSRFGPPSSRAPASTRPRGL
jgi:hypothetical protein